MEITHDNLPQSVARLNEKVDELIRLMTQSTAESETKKQILSVDDVSKLTGYKKTTIHQYVSQGKIPYHKPKHGGRKLIFIPSEIMEWIKSKKPKSPEDFISEKENQLIKKKVGF